MMKFNLLSICLLLILFCSCAATGPYVPGGIVATIVDGPVTVGNEVNAPKKGEACAINILGLVAAGDNSINEAKRNGDIKKVSTVDYNTLGILGLFVKVCTVVKGY